MIQQFRDEYSWLSNFAPMTIIHNGIAYPTVEHFYVAMKTNDIEKRIEVSKLKSPGEAKKYGKTLEIREGWDTNKKKVMEYALNKKYRTEPYRTKLLETGDQEIIEGNFWNDQWWGVCLKTGEGMNILGNIIMDIREDLRNE